MVGGRKEKSTFGTRMPIDIYMLNEIIYRECKGGTLLDPVEEEAEDYLDSPPVVPSVHSTHTTIPVAGKFYAAHDALKETETQSQKVDDYTQKVSQMRAQGPRVKYPTPATSNQTYGWYEKPLLPFNRNDRRFYHPKRESSHTKVEVVIRMANPTNKKTKN